METEKKKETEEPVNSLEEFTRFQGLVDWPVTYEEDAKKTSAKIFPFTNPEHISSELKKNVPFPAHITRSLLQDVEELWARVKGHESRLFLVKCEVPVKKLTSEEENLLTKA